MQEINFTTSTIFFPSLIIALSYDNFGIQPFTQISTSHMHMVRAAELKLEEILTGRGRGKGDFSVILGHYRIAYTAVNDHKSLGNETRFKPGEELPKAVWSNSLM